MLAVSMSAPWSSNLSTSSLSPDIQAAKKTHPDENFIRRPALFFGCSGSRAVWDSSQRFNCSARFDTAVLLRVSNDILLSEWWLLVQLLFARTAQRYEAALWCCFASYLVERQNGGHDALRFTGISGAHSRRSVRTICGETVAAITTKPTRNL